jgi:hypothetical protein
VKIEDPDAPRNEPVASKVADDTPKVHQEKEGFTGDRVLRNSQIFMQDFGWWIEFCHSVPEGNIGRAFEIMKVSFWLLIAFLSLIEFRFGSLNLPARRTKTM